MIHYRMRSLRANIHIFPLLALLPLVAALTSCGHDDPDPGIEFNVRAFTVSGVVYDSSESIPGVPLEDIKISISAYWNFDTEREGDPFYAAVTRTSSDGRYAFSYSKTMTMQNAFLVIKVVDDSKKRSVHFKPIEQELYLRPHNAAYDDVTMSYNFRDNDFYMYPES